MRDLERERERGSVRCKKHHEYPRSRRQPSNVDDEHTSNSPARPGMFCFFILWFGFEIFYTTSGIKLLINRDISQRPNATLTSFPLINKK